MSLFPQDALLLARTVLDLCRSAELKLSTAESCTGGLIAACLTEIAGSSDVFDRGFVTYSNLAKQQLLGVRPQTLAIFGAVSEQTAVEMAEGGLNNSDSQLCIAITGIAGPGGGDAAKPVGLVHVSAALKGARTAHGERRFGNPGRSEIRLLSLFAALRLAENTLREASRGALK
jgi:nicotinamide-nucleotide amidase